MNQQDPPLSASPTALSLRTGMKSRRLLSLLALFVGLLCFLALLGDALSWNLPQAAASSRLKSLSSLIPTKNYSRTFSLEAQEELARGNNSHILSEKILHYCKSLSLAGAAIVEEPYNTRYLLNWANIRQLLGSTPCRESHTDGDVVRTLDMALIATPQEPSVLYSAGLIYLWSDKKEKARELFGKVLRYGQSLSQGQKAIILNSIEEPEDIATVIPGKFPHVIAWHERLMSAPILQRDIRSAERTVAAIGRLQLEALTENREELDAGIITQEIFEQRLYDLLVVTTDSQARRFIDGEFSTSVYPNSDSAEHQFFLNRSGLTEYPLVRSFLPLDTRPLKTSLVRWGKNDKQNFAGSYNTLGFFVHPGQPVSVISLQSRSTGRGVERTEIDIFISGDNNEWKEITDSVKTTSFQVLDQQWVSLSLSTPIVAPYWKIHLSGTEKTKQFVNYVNEMVRAFGPSEEGA